MKQIVMRDLCLKRGKTTGGTFWAGKLRTERSGALMLLHHYGNLDYGSIISIAMPRSSVDAIRDLDHSHRQHVGHPEAHFAIAPRATFPPRRTSRPLRLKRNP